MEVLLEIVVCGAQFLESWYVGDPENQEDSDFDEDLEVRGRASGLISYTLDPSQCEDLSECLGYEGSNLETLAEWFEEEDCNYLSRTGRAGPWSSEITNLDQNISESEIPRDRDDEHLSRATIDLSAEGNIESVCISLVGETDEERILWKAEFDSDSNLFKGFQSDDLCSHEQICKSLSQALKAFSEQ